MCQPKSKGGKRCAAHMRGSRAATKEAEVYTNADKGLVSRVFKFLRQEGKNLPDPTQREVEDYADGQRIRARFDPELGNRDRNTLVRNWQEAREERPDGGVFHAWKNLRAETASRMKRIGAGIALATSASLVVAGCGGALDNGEQTPPPTSSPTQTQSPDDGDTTEPDASEHEYDLGGGIVGGEAQSDRHGEYTQITLDDDSPLMQYDESVVDDAVLERYSEEEILEAQRTASTFAVEEGLDSTLVFDYDEGRAQAWVDENGDIFSSEYREDFSAEVLDGQEDRISIIDSYSGQQIVDDNGDVVSGRWVRGNPVYGDNGSRWDSLDVTLEEVTLLPTGDIAFRYSASGSRPITDPENSSITATEVNNHSLHYSFENEGGAWKLSGYDNHLDTSVVMD